jgi:hypothetical protein
MLDCNPGQELSVQEVVQEINSKVDIDGSTPMDELKTDTISTADGSTVHNVSKIISVIDSGIQTGPNEMTSVYNKYSDGTFEMWGKSKLQLGSGSFTHILDTGSQSYPFTVEPDYTYVSGEMTFLGSGNDGSNIRENSSWQSVVYDTSWTLSILSGGEDFSGEVGKWIKFYIKGVWDLDLFQQS